MRTAKTISITLPPELLSVAQEVAEREHRTVSELFGEAFRRYISEEYNWNAVLERARARGRAAGVESEDDVERIVHRYRRSRKVAPPPPRDPRCWRHEHLDLGDSCVLDELCRVLMEKLRSEDVAAIRARTMLTATVVIPPDLCHHGRRAVVVAGII